MDDSYRLQLLDPATDLDCYRQAYSWRLAKRHVQPDRMPFETFASEHPAHVTLGLFNGELQAVYFLCEVEPAVYEVHFTSQRGVLRETLLDAARQVARLFLTNGAVELRAWIMPRNRALCQFLLDLGFVSAGYKDFSGQNDTDRNTLPSTRNQRQMFVKYAN